MKVLEVYPFGDKDAGNVGMRMPDVNPEILIWARETAGLSPEEAVRKLSIRPARGVAALDRLAEYETGAAAPTRPLLVKMAKQYRRPLLAFYMSRPPRTASRGEDFRTLPTDHDPVDDALLDALLRGVQVRQEMVRSLLEDSEEAEVRGFVGSMSTENGVGALVASIRDTLGLSLEDYRSARHASDAFSLLRQRVENAGVFVLLIGNLGSHHTDFDVRTFRGFALADAVAPFVVINPHDARAAWTFTLLHELAHLWLGQTGVSAVGYRQRAIERFCDQVASEYLLPDDHLNELRLPGGADLDMLVAVISEFARERNISSAMVAYRLWDADRIHQATWRQLSTAFRDRWREHRAAQRESNRERDVRISIHTVRQHRAGALARLVRRMLAAGELTQSKAGTVLGVKPMQVGALVDAIPQQQPRGA